jgi:hypothetical protein
VLAGKSRFSAERSWRGHTRVDPYLAATAGRAANASQVNKFLHCA